MLDHTLVRQNTIFGDGVVTGNLAVNGGSVTTTQVTASIFNTTTTTLNIGGAATAINIGASGGLITSLANVTISNTAPTLTLTDITASAKSLKLLVDANVASFYESAGAAGDILSLDLVNERVGIGTTSPVAKLDFGASMTNQPQILNLYSSGNVRMGFGQDNATASLRVFSPSGRFMAFGHIDSTDGSTWNEKMRLSSNGGLSLGNSYVTTDPGAGSMIISGNVGIGTTGPSQALTIGNGGIEIIRTSNPFILFDQGGTDVGQLRALDTTHLAVTNGAGGSSYLTVDTSSGNVIIGATAAGATAAKTLVLTNSATDPTTSADLAHLYAKDISAGNAALAIYAETAAIVAAGIASTHKIPIYYNGTVYYLMASDV